MKFENVEEKKVSFIDWRADNGLVVYWEVYEDQTRGQPERTGVDTGDRAAMKKLKRELEIKYGADKVNEKF